MVRSNITLQDFDAISGVSTKCFTYDKETHHFIIEMSELGFIDESEFFIRGRLCRSNGILTFNDRNTFGSIVLKSHRTGVRAFFTFEKEEKNEEGELLAVIYRYFGTLDDPQGKNPTLRQCKIYVVND